jgi:hypothetical protein
VLIVHRLLVVLLDHDAAVHPLAFVALEQFVVHAALFPVPELVLPAPQAVQLDWPVVVLYDPFAHDVQVVVV